ncbi:HAL/PAL/TAL family ammonia-lyase [Parapusillimonas granuli]|nr:aromatic amino acid lyase [Parapusillimonas granuli]MBB5213360.1 histidine ammonia-lyase [Parapusillimonas granuli]
MPGTSTPPRRAELMPERPSIVLSGGGLRIEDVLRVMRERPPVAAEPAVLRRLQQARRVVEQHLGSGAPVYGLTTALGANVGKAIAPSELQAYQSRAIQARSVGIGEAASDELVRGVLFTRLAGLSTGGSGISPEVFDALLALLNAGICPLIPRVGSIGVADLPAMSHAMLVLMGQGRARVGGKEVDGAQALADAGLAPVALGPKDGLALISSNAWSVSCAIHAFDQAGQALANLSRAATLTMEGFRANLSPLDARVQAARPTPGQAAAAAHIRALLDGSGLWEKGAARRVQDPLSIRCVAQIHGAVLWARQGLREHIECELNGSGDSPLVVQEPDELLSSSNFHIPGLALSLEALGVSLAQAASAAVQRCLRLYSPGASGLPMQLTQHGPEHSGFATVQKTLTALWSEVRHLANPACLDFFPVSEGAEDHALMAPGVAAKTARLAERVTMIAAIEMLSAAQAVDLAQVSPRGAGTRDTYARIRATAPVLDGDRPLGPDMDAIIGMLRERPFDPPEEAAP